ncbi:addiction module protein [Sorangium sp. So ce131]|uniref:addiction module protein n=1 Tax=Sorangium sp. So ce131 TaxID=3133282 RepID=UPI003F619D0A
MNLPELETEALKLPVAERARLAETLLASLDELSEEEHRRLWTEGAVDALAASPLAGSAVENEVRWWLVRRFPHSVL